MKKKAWYTLLEMLIVVIIIGILASIGRSRLANFDTNKYHAERCVNQIYGEISSFTYFASTSKIFSEDKIPETYELAITWNNTFNLQYTTTGSTQELYSTINLANLESCKKGKNYEIKSEGSFDKLIMLPSFKPVGNKNGFSIINNRQQTNLFTWAIALKYCSPSDNALNNCSDFARILFDTRIGTVRKSFCKYYEINNDKINNDKKCRERTTDF